MLVSNYFWTAFFIKGVFFFVFFSWSWEAWLRGGSSHGSGGAGSCSRSADVTSRVSGFHLRKNISAGLYRIIGGKHWTLVFPHWTPTQLWSMWKQDSASACFKFEIKAQHVRSERLEADIPLNHSSSLSFWCALAFFCLHSHFGYCDHLGRLWE